MIFYILIHLKNINFASFTQNMYDAEMKKITTAKALLENNLIQDADLEAISRLSEQYAIAITPEMLTLIQNAAPKDAQAIRKQFVPDIKELDIQPEELMDPIADEAFSPVKGIVHRHFMQQYADRCLLKIINVCPVYCRFCFRREQIGPGSDALSAEDIDIALHYIANHPEILEVILTGGDPLMLKAHHLKSILQKLEAIPHVEILRIHTRVPVVDPTRITDALIAALKLNKPVFVALHANHPSEFTTNAKAAIAKFVDAGIPMLSQSVLLKGVNDDLDTLKALMRCFLQNRVKPYYLHHPDLARGTSHFRPDMEVGKRLMKELQRSTSGLCQPHYVVDKPHEGGKVPLH